MKEGVLIQYNSEQLLITGQSESELSFCDENNCLLHEKVLPYFRELQLDAEREGFGLAVASSYRSLERQMILWNGKVNGERAVFNDAGERVDILTLNNWQLVQAILRWSALPGTSRHHWGTDMDVYDQWAIPDGYQLQLIVDETTEGGVFADFHHWLDRKIEKQNSHGFYRPYAKDSGGVGCEPWHISYRPLADHFSSMLTIDLIAAVVSDSELLLKDTVLEHLEEIYHRYICMQYKQ